MEKENTALRARLEQTPEINDIATKLKKLRVENDLLRAKMTINFTPNDEKEVATRQPQIKSPRNHSNHPQLTNKYNMESSRVLPNRPASSNPTPDYLTGHTAKFNGDYNDRQHFRSNNIGKRTKSVEYISRTTDNYDHDTRNYNYDNYEDAGYENRNLRYGSEHTRDHSSRTTSNHLENIMQKYGGGGAEGRGVGGGVSSRHRRSHSSGNFGKNNSDESFLLFSKMTIFQVCLL